VVAAAPVAATVGASNPLWYTTRGTAFVSLVLITLSVVGGVLNAVRWRDEGWPRFVVQQLHRNCSLLALSFLSVHIVTAVVDPFAKLKVTDAIIPFTSSYRSLWLGFGVVAVELVIAVTVTSLLRGHLGFRTWRAIHWLAYLAWPIALVHGLGTGTDARTLWGVTIDVLCISAVLLAVLWRASDGWPRWAAVKSAALAGTGVVAVVIGAWAVRGPLRAGWAREAGTPQALLAASGQGRPGARGSTSGQGAPAPTATPTPAPSLVAGLRDMLQGTTGNDPGGALRVTLDDTTNPSIHLVLVVQTDNTATLTVTRSGSTVCAVPAQVGRGVVAVCDSLEVRLELQQTDDGGVVGQMTTRAGG